MLIAVAHFAVTYTQMKRMVILRKIKSRGREWGESSTVTITSSNRSPKNDP